jgi:hypothetical protein
MAQVRVINFRLELAHKNKQVSDLLEEFAGPTPSNIAVIL